MLWEEVKRSHVPIRAAAIEARRLVLIGVGEVTDPYHAIKGGFVLTQGVGTVNGIWDAIIVDLHHAEIVGALGVSWTASRDDVGRIEKADLHPEPVDCVADDADWNLTLGSAQHVVNDVNN
ncbi:hypothetical protein D3C84_758110 [compost metagenome]